MRKKTGTSKGTGPIRSLSAYQLVHQIRSVAMNKAQVGKAATAPQGFMQGRSRAFPARCVDL